VSAENVERVRRIYEHFSAREWDAGFALADNDIEWNQVGPFPDANVYRGKRELKERLIDGFLMAFEDFHFDLDELIDSGEHVAAVGTARGQGGSGLQFALRFLHLWRFRDGKVVWVYDCAGESVRP
jgi:uncharacterized protein